MSQLAAVAFPAILVLVTSAPAAEPVRRPNIVWIVKTKLAEINGQAGQKDK